MRVSVGGGAWEYCRFDRRARPPRQVPMPISSAEVFHLPRGRLFNRRSLLDRPHRPPALRPPAPQAGGPGCLDRVGLAGAPPISVRPVDRHDRLADTVLLPVVGDRLPAGGMSP